MDRKERILSFISRKDYIPLLRDELAAILDVPGSDLELFYQLLDELEQDGLLVRAKKGRIMTAQKAGLMVGSFIGHSKGFGFVVIEGASEDMYIPQNATGTAMHGDTVTIRLLNKAANGKRAEGEVIRINKRAVKTLVCTYQATKFSSIAIPDEKRIWQEITIPYNLNMNAKSGQKVVVEITGYPENINRLEGKVLEILGYGYDPRALMLSIIRSHGLEEEFPHEVLNEAEHVKTQIEPEEINGRVDLRELNIITIDGEDAKDLDDAVYLERLANGNYKLSVHIADVTHYVREKHPLDKEALKRGTSVYIVGSVIPMLPRRLSNGICSLNPGVDRLTLSVDMEISPNGDVVDHIIYTSVIKSAERMTYADVTALLDGDSELQKRYANILDMLLLMRELAELLKQKRRQSGSIDFNFPETKFKLDENNKPIEVYPYPFTISNSIIEEFMLLCNQTVAEHFFWLSAPFVYRVHEQPSPEKLENLNKFLYNFGKRIKGSPEDIHPKALQQVMDSIKGSKEELVIGTIMLRSMMKARYSPENLGHFGLSARYYCHFTSPIRRYPDLAIHRIIKEYLNGPPKADREENLRSFAAVASELSSQREVIAEETERDSVKLKMAEYMQEHIGEEFEGIIGSITSFGFFVELDNTVEGLVRLADLKDDYYEFYPDSLSLIGQRRKKVFKIGDSVRIEVLRSSPEQLEIDFMLVD